MCIYVGYYESSISQQIRKIEIIISIISQFIFQCYKSIVDITLVIINAYGESTFLQYLLHYCFV